MYESWMQLLNECTTVYLWRLNNVCSSLCVCVWARHCWKNWRTSWWIGALHVEEADGDVSILMFFFFFCVYVWRIPPHLGQFYITNGQTPVKHGTPPPTSQVYVLIYVWLPGHFSSCPVNTNLFYLVWGSISFPLVLVVVDTQELVWTTVIAFMAVRCHTPAHILTLTRSENGQLALHFLDVL